jgi:hypothetical protein
MLDKARAQKHLINYGFLKKPVEKWKNRDYVEFAMLLDLSTSTLKRLFACKGHPPRADLREHCKTKITVFLNLKSWDEVEQTCLILIFKKGQDIKIE